MGRWSARGPASPRIRSGLPAVLVVLLLAACGADAPGTGPDPDDRTSPPPPGEPATTTTTTATTTAPAQPPGPEPGDPGSRPAADPPRQVVWVHLFDDALKDAAGVDEVLDSVAAAGLDGVVVQVVRRHDAYYPSEVLPPTPDPARSPDFDVVAAVVAGARARDLQVHAWISVGPVHHPVYADLELADTHVWVAHGPASPESWMAVDVDGQVSPDFLDVGLPAVRTHVAAVAAELVSRYDVDGVHLDYVRHEGQQWGYHPEVLAAFAAATGRADRPTPDDPGWSDWRRAGTAALVSEVRAAVDSARPGVVLSAAVIAGGPGPAESGGFARTRAPAEFFQDWPAWLDTGSVDWLLAMAYTREHVAEQARSFRDWTAFLGDLAAEHPERGVSVGVGAYLNAVDAAADQVRLAHRATGRVAIYSWQQDSADGPRGELLARMAELTGG